MTEFLSELQQSSRPRPLRDLHVRGLSGPWDFSPVPCTGDRTMRRSTPKTQHRGVAGATPPNRRCTLIRVLIAEDVVLLRKALVALLQLEPDIEVVAEASSGRDIVRRALESDPDVAVLDIGLPEKDGFTAALELRECLPGCKTVILSGLVARGHVSRALDAGISGILLKQTEPADVIAAIRDVSSGRRVYSPEIALLGSPKDGAPLSPREIEILGLAAQGHSIPDIASRLFLSPGTVRNYLTACAAKLTARNRLDAIRIAKESGWI